MSNLGFTVRKAEIQDIDSIIEFIKTDWSENHIFVKDPAFFNYFYVNKHSVSFMVGINNLSQKIEAILGYQSYTVENDDIFLALWKSRKGCEDSTLGLKLLEYLKKSLQPKRMHCLGINKKTINIYKFMGYHVGTMEHFCYFNAKLKQFDIATPVCLIENKKITSEVSIEKISNSNITQELYSKVQKNHIPVKSFEVFHLKYCAHPYYDYSFFKVQNNNILTGFLVLRRITVEKKSCLRIMDFVGDVNVLPDAMITLGEALFDEVTEYIDLYSAGLNAESFRAKNILLVSDYKEIIVPNYFEPFEKKNVEIYYFSTIEKDFVFFKGDGDQDRPSIAKVIGQ